MSTWHYLIDQTNHGPVTTEDLCAAISGNQLSPDTFVWKEGMEKWLPADQVPELATTLAAAPVHLIPPEITTQAEPVHLKGSFPVTLTQKKTGNPQQVLILESPEILVVRTGSGRNIVERRIDLTLVDPVSERVRKPYRKSLILVIPCALFSIVIIIAGIAFVCLKGTDSILGSIGGIGFGSAFFWIPALLFYRQMIAKSVNAHVFQLHRSDPLVIHADKPDVPTVDAFVAQLKEAITHLQATRPQMAAALFQSKAEIAAPPAPTGCVNCQSPDVVPGFAAPLCQPCRTKLIRFPFPLWLKGAIAVIVIMLLVAATRLPKEFSAAVALKRGEKADASGDFSAAVTQYPNALASYPDSPSANRHLAAAAYRAGDLPTARAAAAKLVSPNGEVSKDDIGLVQQINGARP